MYETWPNNFSFNSSIDTALSSISWELSNLRSNGSTFESHNVEFLSNLDKIAEDLKDVHYGSPVE